MWKSRSQIFKGSWDLDCRQKPCICVATHGVVSEHQRWSTVINCQRSLKSFKVCFLVISSFSYRMQADVLQDLMEEDLPVWQWLVAALWSLWRFWIHFVRFPTAPFFASETGLCFLMRLFHCSIIESVSACFSLLSRSLMRSCCWPQAAGSREFVQFQYVPEETMWSRGYRYLINRYQERNLIKSVWETWDMQDLVWKFVSWRTPEVR